MTLIDTSVWLDHFDASLDELEELILKDQVLIHPFVMGEIAMGNWRLRAKTLTELTEVPTVVIVRPEEVLRFINEQKLYGIGIGYVDAHLLAAVRVTPGADLWTRDKRLRTAAAKLGIASPLI